MGLKIQLGKEQQPEAFPGKPENRGSAEQLRVCAPTPGIRDGCGDGAAEERWFWMRLSGIRTDISQEFMYQETPEKHKDERKSEQSWGKMRELGLSASVCPSPVSW